MGGRGRIGKVTQRPSPLYKLADNRPSALGEHSERTANPTFILSAASSCLTGSPSVAPGSMAEGTLSDSCALAIAEPLFQQHLLGFDRREIVRKTPSRNGVFAWMVRVKPL